MKKLLEVGSLAFVAVMGLAGCKSGTASTSVASTATSTSTSTVASTSTEDLTSYNFTVKVGSPAKQVAKVVTNVANYVKGLGYTNVKVEAYNLEESDADSKVADWSTGPDVYAFAGDKLLNLVKQGALAKVSAANVTSMVTNMGQAVVDAASLGDAGCYAYPFTTNTFFMYYNNEYVSAAQAKSMETLIAANKAASLKTNYSVKNSWYGIPFLSTFGAKWTISLDDTGKAIGSIKADFNGANGLKAAKALVGLIQNKDVVVTDDSGPVPTQANGIGSVMTGSWRDTDMKAGLTTHYAATNLPTITQDGTTASCHNFLGYKMYGINPSAYAKDTVRAALDQKIAAYLVSKDAQVARYTDFATAPLDKTAVADPTISTDQTVVAVANEVANSVAQTVVPSNCWSAYDALYTSITGATETITDTMLQGWLDTFNAAIEKIA
jgi:arabinogalactan oligomer/maltooligosaccharide transport system substrate-binding protein